MSYDNAEPKILKTLNSSGQVLDDAGNVISETSDYWVRTYNQAEPKVDKILHSDGTIKDGAGNLIQDATSFNIKKYNQAEPMPAKYLHSDGTIDENAGGAGANLEDNKEVEITENGEIEITPSSGYDGMKKVTATVNVSGGTAKLYVWKYTDEQSGNEYYLMTPTETLTENTKVFVNNNESGMGFATLYLVENSEEDTYYRFTENGIEYSSSGYGQYDLYTRSPSDDINLF